MSYVFNSIKENQEILRRYNSLIKSQQAKSQEDERDEGNENGKTAEF